MAAMKKPHKQKSPQQGAPTGGKPAEQAKAPSVAVKEDGGEPVVRRDAVPVLLIGLLGALVYWGNMHIVEHGGELDARVHSPYRSFKEISDLQPKDEDRKRFERGFRVYHKPACVSCHQSDGNGSAALNAPPLVRSEWVLEKDPSRLIRIVLHGLSGPIKVLDKEYGAVAMLGWKDTLTDQEIADVLTYIRNDWGNKAPVVKVEQVTKIREETKGHTGYMTAADLEKVVLKK